MKNTVLFDLGGTLVHYFEMAEFPDILEQSITSVQSYLRGRGLLHVSLETMWQKVREENYEAEDYCVRPMEERLFRIFHLNDTDKSDSLGTAMCQRFMKPVFDRAHCYEDALPTIQALRSEGFKTAIISNTTWGSPASLWRQELVRHGLDKQVDTIVFCRDVGWRKPAKQIFEFTLERLHVLPADCIFVGDDPRWDLVGPETIGIKAILLERRGPVHSAGEHSIQTLYQLRDRLLL